MGSKIEITDYHIRRKLRRLHITEKLKDAFDEEVSLNHNKMECLKDTFKSSIWRLQFDGKKTSYPIILKVFKPLRKKRVESLVELNMYQKANRLLQDFMPQMYLIKSDVLEDDDVWVFMEHIQQLSGQVAFTPQNFDRIIPTLTKLHANTCNERFHKQRSIFADWLPQYNSRALEKGRQEMKERTLQYLDAAMDHRELNELLSPSYALLVKIIQKGPDYFPNLERAQSIIHNDLSTLNISCNNIGQTNWNIKLIDWEGAKFAPCWFDMYSLVGVSLAYRSDWQNEEEQIVRRCASLYAEEMKKRGVEFSSSAIDMYKMAYLQRLLEKGLYLQLRWKLAGKEKGNLLHNSLEKIKEWGADFGLY